MSRIWPLCALVLAGCPPDPDPPETATEPPETSPTVTTGAPDAGMPYLAWWPAAALPTVCPAVFGYVAGPLFAVSDAGADCLDEGACASAADEAACLTAGACEEKVPLPLLPEGAPLVTGDADLAGAGLPPALARYCLYAAEPGHGNEPPRDLGALGWQVDRAQRVIAPAATAVETDLRAYYAATTRAETSLCAEGRTRVGEVRLTLLDTAPTGAVADLPAPIGTEGHGEALAAALDALTCAGAPDCHVAIRTRAALPLRTDDALATTWTVPAGGRYGSLDWLAQAIVREVRAWQRWSPDAHLVLNLSLGWHEDYGGSQLPLSEPDRADARAVYDAIRFARCSGALVFAAAGNRYGGGLDQGPLYPAAWAEVTIDPGICASELGVPATLTYKAPLVFAVGGVGADDQPLAVSRDDSEPQFVAYGDHFDHEGFGALAPLTGSSAATAVVAAAAAHLWSEAPSLTADEVALRLYAAGDDVGRFASAAYGDVPTQFFGTTAVHRITGGCEAADPRPPALVTDGAPLSGPVQSGSLAAILPSDPSPAYDPYAHPQPTGTFCPVCAVDLPPAAGPAVLYLNLPLFPGTIANARLATYTGTWSQIPLGSLLSPSTVAVSGIVGTPSRALFLFDANGTSYFSELRVLP